MDKKKKEMAENAIRQLAKRDGVTVGYVRRQIRIAILTGLCSTDPGTKAYWVNIPCEGDAPTPEELIIYTAELVKHRMGH